MNATTAARNLHVADTCRAKLLLFVAGAAEDCMGMRIHKTGSEHAAAAIDALRIRVVALDVVTRCDCADFLTIDGNRRILENLNVAGFLSSPSARGTSARDDPRGVDENELGHAKGVAITSRTREMRIGACAK